MRDWQLGTAARRIFVLAAWTLLISFALAAFMGAVRSGDFGKDFHFGLWQPARDALHGLPLYPAPDEAALHASGVPFLYTPSALAVGGPFAALPLWLALGIWTALLFGSVALALRVLDVRDPRCYALALFALPTIEGVRVGNLTMAYVLGLAVVWRYRQRALVVGAVAGAMIAVKLFVWPLAVWLLVTRRMRALAATTAVAFVSVGVAWLALGFEGLREYPALLSAATDYLGRETSSLWALGTGLGLSGPASSVLQAACGLAVLVALVLSGRGHDGDRRAFTLAIVAAITLAPITWLHGFALLVVPIAIWRPRMSAAWLVLPAFWLRLLLPAPDPSDGGIPDQRPAVTIGLAFALMLVAVLATDGRIGRPLQTR